MQFARRLTRAHCRLSITRSCCVLVALYTSGGWLAAHAELVVDGHFDEAEWQQAITCEDWRRTLPFARDEPRYRSHVRLLSTESGLAAAFVLDQPPQERRIKPRTPRDARSFAGDNIALVVDFDATGQIGYEFAVGLGGGVRDAVVTNQNQFDLDWDASWQHAVRETDEQWFVEMLIPWAAVSMRESRTQTRTIGVYTTRYVFERAERYACPGISSESAVFLGDFRRIEISQQKSAAAFDFVPYATSRSDLINDDTQLKVGADLTWKLSPNLRLAATLNPDFGQVESDELVVDFSATETVFSDKRPFFTENQGLFDLRTPANGQLIYTRRIGSAPDDLSAGSSDIDAALKLTGTAASLVYGAFMAQERNYRDDAGRLFAAARLALPLEQARVGYLTTWTDRPFLDRDAWINAVDYELTPSEQWRLSGQVIRSQIGYAGFDEVMDGAVQRSAPHSTGYESWLQADFNRSAPLTHTLKLLYSDERFDLNDLGYMERNSLRQAEWETNRRAVGDLTSSMETQRFYVSYRENAAGERLQSRIQLSRDVQYASAWNAYQELRYTSSGVDDLISRGNGPVRLDERYSAYFDVTSPRFGAWQFIGGGYLFQQGVQDYSGRLQFLTIWYPTEKLTLRLDLLPYYFEDWLLWEEAELFGAYRGKRLDFDFRVDWIPAPRHELRLRWQWIGLQADARQAYRADARGELLPAPVSLAPFTVNNLGVQVRYRYEIGPLSELFLVYARGGFDLLRDDERSVTQLFHDLPQVRDADQFLVKIRYRL